MQFEKRDSPVGTVAVVTMLTNRIEDTGDFENEALRDFIRESNRTGRVVFSNSLETGIAALR